MKKIVGIIFMISLLSFASSSMAVGLKIGVIDLQKILQASPQVKTADSSFKKEFAPREAKIKSAVEALQKQAEDFKRNVAVMTEKQKTTTQEKLVNERNQIQQQQAQFSQDAQATQAKVMKGILSKIHSIVTSISKKGNYDLVIQKSTTVYYKREYNITRQVIAALK